MYKKRRKNIGIKILIFLMLIALILGIGFHLLSHCSVTTVYVEGNLHYSTEEIQNMVMEGPLGHNSLYLSMKYKEKGVENIPFVDVMDVDILAPDTIKITVYEKSLAGYVEFMDTFMYFDKDGYVIESSDVKTIGVPQITGLKFDYLVLGERLPIADNEVFETIMDITKLLGKYELVVEKIHYKSHSDITLIFDKIKVSLGSDDKLEEKIMDLPVFLMDLQGKSGTLRMENYSEDEKMVVFEMDNLNS
ncbi:MAG: FtsQ-type POTRA domain-containing protein [Lachnospiraceae bacterium]|nr:FtsQ-type POTRA domain-containing protein [Lachnospiraceae bacterium]